MLKVVFKESASGADVQQTLDSIYNNPYAGPCAEIPNDGWASSGCRMFAVAAKDPDKEVLLATGIATLPHIHSVIIPAPERR